MCEGEYISQSNSDGSAEQQCPPGQEPNNNFFSYWPSSGTPQQDWSKFEGNWSTR